MNFEQKAAKSAKKEQRSSCLVSFASFACFCSNYILRGLTVPRSGSAGPHRTHPTCLPGSANRTNALLESPGRATEAKRRSPLGKIPALPVPTTAAKATPPQSGD